MGTPNEELTSGEKAALRHYIAYMKRHGHPPTYRELAERIGDAHVNTAYYYVQQLRKKGALTPQPITVRRLASVPTPKGKKAVGS